MHAAVIKDKSISYLSTEDPVITSENEILVAVRAAALNAADLLQVSGNYPPPPGIREDIPGLEYAGIVLEVGKAVTKFKPGDRVMGLVPGEAQAEKLKTAGEATFLIPDGLSFEEATGFSESFFTAYDALIVRANLKEYRNVLVTGAAGGIGMAAVWLSVLKKCKVTASVRHRDLIEPLARHFLRPGDTLLSDDTGSSCTIEFHNGAVLTVCLPQDEPLYGDYDVILDLISGERIPTNLSMLTQNGTIAVIGLLGGATSEIDLRLLLAKRATIFGSTLRSRSAKEKAELRLRIEQEVLPHLANGDVQVAIHASFPLVEVDKAYKKFKEGKKIGKIILTMT